MLDIKLIRRNQQLIEESLKRRGVDGKLDDLLKIDSQRNELLAKIEKLRHEQKTISKEYKGKPPQETLQSLEKLSETIKITEKHLKEINLEIQQRLYELPNILHHSVAKDENQVVYSWGTPPKFDFSPKPHWELAENLDIIDFQRATKVAGARFSVFKGDGASLIRALINFMLHVHTKEHHYIEILPPLLINKRSMINTGQLPKFEDDLFKCADWDFYLVPTAEVPLTNLHQNEILNEDTLPIYYVAYTPCFRAEAGSWGKDTKGLIRQHQFDKVELVKFTTPQTSYQELEKLVEDVQDILCRLQLPFRVVNLKASELSFAAAKCYDIEVWMPYQGRYVEISSCSNCEDFQARRAKIRFRRKDTNQLEYVHTLNGSGVAVGRCAAAILENHQQEDGSVVIPQPLCEYLDGLKIIKRKKGKEVIFSI